RRATALEKAGGNPRFLEEYSQNPTNVVPKVVKNTVADWLSCLPKETKHIAEALATLEQPISLGDLATISESGEAAVSDQVTRLMKIGLVDSSIALRYPAVRDALYSGMVRTKRGRLHAKAY